MNKTEIIEKLRGLRNRMCLKQSDSEIKTRVKIFKEIIDELAYGNSGGIELIAEERKRQIEVEGWTKEHDQDNSVDDLAIAAACYAVNKSYRRAVIFIKRGFFWESAWPWSVKWDKRDKHDRKRSLVIAGALAAAALDRLQQDEKQADA